MIDLLEEARSVLAEHDYIVGNAVSGSPTSVLFETEMVIGFVLAYPDVPTLLSNWRQESTELLERHQLGVRRSMEKAWNAYLVLLSRDQPDRLGQALLDSIEEDLVGLRKIARAGLASRVDVSRALLPLLPFQNRPNLSPVDMEAEIRIRSSQLPGAAVDAFFSTRDTATIIQLFEEL